MPIQQPSGQIKCATCSLCYCVDLHGCPRRSQTYQRIYCPSEEGGETVRGTEQFVTCVKCQLSRDPPQIACYKNKVQEWRNGVETNLDDVLQVANVFVNVSKGEVARHQDLQKAFGTTDIDPIVKEVCLLPNCAATRTHSCSQILKKGELQVGEKEREHDLSALRKEIATLIAEKCVDPTTQRPYPVGVIDKAMTEAGFSVKQGKTAKSQVSEAIRLIQSESKLPIQRARMRVRVTIPTKDGKRLREQIIEGAEKVEVDEMGQDEWEVVRIVNTALAHLAYSQLRTQILLIDPGQFRVINELLQKESKGKGRIETLTFAATASS